MGVPTSSGFRGQGYRRTGGLRLWRGAGVASILALLLAGCSMSSQFDSYFGSSKDVTGSITPPPGAKGEVAMPPEMDLVYARAAASELLRRGEKDTSLPWENPRSGARGTVTPIAAAYTQDGQTCRNFLASYVNGSAQSWMQGEACRQNRGAWEVRSLKPWKNS